MIIYVTNPNITATASNDSNTTTTTTTTTASTTNNKYDRQLRLWGATGQYNISHTCIIMIINSQNSNNNNNYSSMTSVGTETLKNLILPGIQHIHIYDISTDISNDSSDDLDDDVMVDTDTDNNDNNDNINDSTGSSLACNNFFMTKEFPSVVTSSTTTAIATTNTNTTTKYQQQQQQQMEMMIHYLLELNPDVTGSYSSNSNADKSSSSSNNNNNNKSIDDVISTTLYEIQSLYERCIIVGIDLCTTDIQMIYNCITVSSLSLSSSNTASSSTLTTMSLLQTIPFITVQSYGLMGILQIPYLPFTPIICPNGITSTTTTTNATSNPDLHIANPFTSLQQYMEDFIITHFGISPISSSSSSSSTSTSSLSTSPIHLSTHEYGNIPYPIILYYTYQYIWKKKYATNDSSNNNSKNNNKPITYAQKQEFISMIQEQYYNITTTSTDTGGNNNNKNRNVNDLPLNVQEAIKHSYLAYTERTIDIQHLQSTIQTISSKLSSSSSSSIQTKECIIFYIVLQAIVEFIHSADETNTTTNNSCSSSNLKIPVHGIVPDMTASTHAYIELQSIYKQQSIHDIQCIQNIIHNKYMNLNNNCNNNNNNIQKEDITDEYIRMVLQNIHSLDILQQQMLHPNPTQQQSNEEENNIEEIVEMFNEYTDNENYIEEDVQIPFLWYICYEACQLYYTNQPMNDKRYPGCIRICSSGSSNNQNDDIHDNDENDEQQMLQKDAEMVQYYIHTILETKYPQLYHHPVIQRTILQPYITTTTNDDDNVDTTSTNNNTTSTAMETNTTTTTTSISNEPHHPHYVPSKYAIEMVRYGYADIYTVGSIMGGITSQEIIKCITHQYHIMKYNTFIYNGITSTTGLYQL